MSGIGAPIKDYILWQCTFGQCSGWLNGIVAAVFVNGIDLPQKLQSINRRAYNSAKRCLEDILRELTATATVSEINMNKVLSLANNLLYTLNSALANLRPGNTDWNISVGDGFDPEEWVHIDNAGNVNNSHLGFQIMPDNFPQVPPGAVNIFIMYAQNDRVRLGILINNTFGWMRFQLTTAQITTNPDNAFIYSSSNETPLPPPNTTMLCMDQAMYIDTAGQLQPF
jgi:hypothetical protein